MAYVKKIHPESKFNAQNEKMILVGYNSELTGYRVYNPNTETIFIRRNCNFNEKIFPKLSTKKNKTKITITHSPKRENDIAVILKADPQDPEQDQPEENPTPLSDSDSELPSDDEIPITPIKPKIKPNKSNKSTQGSTDNIPKDKQKLSVYQEIKSINEGNFLKEKRTRTTNPKYANIAHTEPKSFNEANKNPKWRQAMVEEFQALLDNETWTLVNLPNGRKPINSKWTYKLKTDGQGNIERYKARLVAVGSSQVKGLDFTKTFAPVVRWETVRTLFTIALQANRKIHHLDVATAFLNGKIDAEIYMRQPQGFAEGNKVCKMIKSIYTDLESNPNGFPSNTWFKTSN